MVRPWSPLVRSLRSRMSRDSPWHSRFSLRACRRLLSYLSWDHGWRTGWGSRERVGRRSMSHLAGGASSKSDVQCKHRSIPLRLSSPLPTVTFLVNNECLGLLLRGCGPSRCSPPRPHRCPSPSTPSTPSWKGHRRTLLRGPARRPTYPSLDPSNLLRSTEVSYPRRGSTMDRDHYSRPWTTSETMSSVHLTPETQPPKRIVLSGNGRDPVRLDPTSRVREGLVVGGRGVQVRSMCLCSFVPIMEWSPPGEETRGRRRDCR